MRTQFIFWSLSFLVFVVFLYIFRAILMPFVAGMILAYFFDPLADRIEKLGLPRWLGASFCLLLFSLIFIIATVTIVPVVLNQLSSLITNLPDLLSRFQLLVGDYIPLDRFRSNESIASPVLSRLASWSGTIASSIWSSGIAILNVVSLFVITPIVAFYLLIDWDRMVAWIDDCLPRRHRHTIRTLFRDMDTAIAAFIRGQGIVCLLLGLFYAISLSLFGLNFGILIGLFAGLISFIPFIGSIIGLLLSLFISILQFWPDYTSILIIVLIFLVGQFVEGNILQPRIVGHSIGLHPVWLIFSLTAFGSLFGFTGLLIAVPVSAALGVLVRFGLSNYRSSSFYASKSGRRGGRKSR